MTPLACATSSPRLRGLGRARSLVLARQVAMCLGRDHTTLIHACRTVDARLGVDRALGARVQQIVRRLGTGSARA